MCGIAGLLQLTGQGIHPKHLLKMPQALLHRGPENLGSWSNSDIFLAQTRLKILDLSEKANQPIFNEDKSIVLVFNGEIYNYKELRSYLLRQDHTFISHGDSETIVHLYEELGESFISKLDGMFAFALWDQKKRKLMLARDRTGKKPLFYYQSSNFLAFASEIKAFFAHPEINIEKNEQYLPYYFIYGNIPTPNTFYKNIYSLEPAHFLVLEKNKSTKKDKYWTLKDCYLNKNDNMSKKEAIGNIQNLLKNAVSKRLISDVPLGVFLSGGIDSTVITAIAMQELQRPLKTFSIGFEGDQIYDETHYARLAANHFHTDHTEYHVGPSSVIESLDHLLYHYDGPFGDSSCLPTAVVSRLAKKEVTVVLTGDGGDEVFAGYNRFLASLWMSKIPALFLRFSKLIESPMTKHPPQLPWIKQWQRLIQAANLSSHGRLTQWTSYFYTDLHDVLNKDFTKHIEISKDFHYTPYLTDIEKMTSLSQMLYLNLNTYLKDDLNIKMDRASMMHSLETRSPFLDHHLIEYCATLPDNFLIRGFSKKYILKEAYKDILPRQIYKRGKAGFGVPLGKWFREPLKSWILDELKDLSSVSHYINPAYVAFLLKSHMEGQDHSLKLWNLLMFKKWIKSLDSWIINSKNENSIYHL